MKRGQLSIRACAWTPERSGFSLIEMLVVIGIIGVLATLAITGTFQFLETQKQSNTETNIRAVYQVLQQHWAKVVADARKEIPSPAVVTLAGNDQDRALVIWVKLRLMEAFPMNFTEIRSSLLYSKPTALNPYIPPGQQKYIAGYLKTLTQLGVTGSNPPRPSESSACLLLALQVNRSGALLNPDSLGSSVTDTDGDGIKEVVDGWGTPLAFYRFPTGNPELTTTYNPNPNARFFDPLDPEGKLVVPAWYTSASLSTFQQLCHTVTAPRGAYIVPVLVSAGRDTKLGIQAVAWSTPNPMALTVPTPVPPQDYDNIYSYRLRLGARGD